MLKIQIDGRINEIFQRYKKYRCQLTIPEEEHPQPLQPEDIAGLFYVVGIKLSVALVWAVGKQMKRRWFGDNEIKVVDINPLQSK